MSNHNTENEIYMAIAHSRAETERGNFAEAYRLICDLPPDAGGLPSIAMLRAALALRLRRYEEALVVFDDLASAAEVCASIQLNRIECLLGLGRLAEAEAALENEESPLQGHYGRHLMLARIAARRRNASLTIEHLRASYRLRPQALACAVNLPELTVHVWTMIINAWPAWRFDPAFRCLN